jgi:subtilisin family serine protease
MQIFSQFPATSEYCTGTPCVLSYTSDQILGLQRVYSLRNTYNIASVNMSLGGGSYTENCDADADYTAEKAAIDTLRSVGIATVIAAGNDGASDAISGPACISTAISVGATDKTDVVASYSNSASILSLLAPGVSIYSSTLLGAYAYKSGTSMATPHVSGAWAVLKSTRPTATVSEILNVLTATGKGITDARNGIVKPNDFVVAGYQPIMPGTYGTTLSETELNALVQYLLAQQ